MRDLRRFEMTPEDWEAVSLVTSWLKSFRSATTQMSITKRPMLLATHAIYTLPDNTPSRLRLGLTQAHRKLSVIVTDYPVF